MGNKIIKDEFTRQWIIDNAIEITSRYLPGELTIRGLHYQLVSIGMTNSVQHYKRVCGAMEQARWDNVIHFETFSDLDRSVVGKTDSELTDLDEQVDYAKDSIRAWMKYYNKNRWENQPYHPEVFIEKKALQNVFADPCERMDVALAPVKGYPPLTFLHETAVRFKEVMERDQIPIILYFGDYDPSGEDIPRSIQDNLTRMGCEVEVRRFALFREQVEFYNLPPAPTKLTDSRTASWDGIGQVELDAMKPEIIRQMCTDAIMSVFNTEYHDILKFQEGEERKEYRSKLVDFVRDLNDENDG